VGRRAVLHSCRQVPVVTVTEVILNFKRPQRDIRGESAGLPNRLRLRLSPEVVIALGMRVKLPGEQMDGEDVELIARHQRADEMTPCERLLGDTLRGYQSLFAHEDAIEAHWRTVEPVLRDVTPVYELRAEHLGIGVG
jgi:glucose-6-phosphate 1-dehydrogenase